MTNYGYTVAHTRTKYGYNDHYQHVEFEVVRTGDFIGSAAVLKVRYQADKDTTTGAWSDHWYAAKLEVETSFVHREDWEAVRGLVNKIYRALGDNRFPTGDPAAFVALLEKIRVPHVIYDPRLGHYVKVEDYKGETYRAYTTEGSYYERTIVMAETEGEARVLISRNWVGSEWGLENWLETGAAVREYNRSTSDYWKPVPDMTTIFEIEQY